MSFIALYAFIVLILTIVIILVAAFLLTYVQKIEFLDITYDTFKCNDADDWYYIIYYWCDQTSYGSE